MKLHGYLFIFTILQISGLLTASEGVLTKQQAFDHAWAFETLNTPYDPLLKDIAPHLCINEHNEFIHPDTKLVTATAEVITDLQRKKNISLLKKIKWGSLAIGSACAYALNNDLMSPQAAAFSLCGAASIGGACWWKQNNLEKIKISEDNEIKKHPSLYGDLLKILQSYNRKKLSRTDTILKHVFQDIKHVSDSSNAPFIFACHGLGDTASGFKKFMDQN